MQSRHDACYAGKYMSTAFVICATNFFLLWDKLFGPHHNFNGQATSRRNCGKLVNTKHDLFPELLQCVALTMWLNFFLLRTVKAAHCNSSGGRKCTPGLQVLSWTNV